MLQREREAEGDEFADKEQFVTQAYKDQMEEVRQAEEEEKKREGMFDLPAYREQHTHPFLELEKAKRGPTTGMAHFYRQLLEKSEAQHSATVAATQSTPTSERRKVIGPAAGPPAQNLTITKPKAEAEEAPSVSDYTPMSDLECTMTARAEGKDVELNDDNQIVNKCELLLAGLNLSALNIRRLRLHKSLM